MNRQAIVILAHGSRNKDAGNAFLSMVQILDKRAGGGVYPAFFSLGRPGLEEVVQELADIGFSRIVIFPYFLFDGNHVRKDIPSLADELKKKHDNIEFELLMSLEHEPLMPEIVYERIWEYSGQARYFDGQDIENSSLEFINQMLDTEFDREQQSIAARVVHASADFSLGRSLRFHPDALKTGLACLKAGSNVVCDVNMVCCALTRCESVLCAVDQPEAELKAEQENTTRSAAGIELLADRLEGALVVIGNAPTALWKVLELAKEKGIVPALVVGVPVGFVGAAQSKKALMNSGLVYISNLGPKGGSPAAGAIVNALVRLDLS